MQDVNIIADKLYLLFNENKEVLISPSIALTTGLDLMSVTENEKQSLVEHINKRSQEEGGIKSIQTMMIKTQQWSPYIVVSYANKGKNTAISATQENLKKHRNIIEKFANNIKSTKSKLRPISFYEKKDPISSSTQTAIYGKFPYPLRSKKRITEKRIDIMLNGIYLCDKYESQGFAIADRALVTALSL